MPIDTTCLICLAPAPETSALTVYCTKQHPMHSKCLTDMICNMGRYKCPYCTSPIPAAETLPIPKPSTAKRMGVIFEHGMYSIVLALYLLTDRANIWHLNQKLMRIRLKYDNTTLIDAEIRDFRKLVTKYTSSTMPLLFTAVELSTHTGAWGWLELLKVFLAVNLIE